MPFIKSVYPGLLLIRILLNFSLKGPITAPLSADYIESSTRGKAVAFTGLGAGIGAIFGVFVLFSLTKSLSYETSFFITAVVYFLFSFVMLFTIKDVKVEQREDSMMSSFFSWAKLKETSRRVWTISKSNRKINISYYGSFVTRMGDILTILFMNVWISSFYGNSDSEIESAKAKGQFISGVGGVAILVLSILVGWSSDKISFAYTITIYYGIRAIFYFLILFADNPSTPQAFIFFFVVYTMNGLLNVVINSYFYKSITKDIKGTVSGIFLFFGTIGILLISKLGSIFFDDISKSGPFLLGAGFDISFIILFLIFK